MTPYDDIIHLPHHVSRNHPQMPMHDRTAARLKDRPEVTIEYFVPDERKSGGIAPVRPNEPHGAMLFP